MSESDTDVCILHDQLANHGGAEEVAFEMARTLDCPIFTARINPEIIPGDIDARLIPMGRLGHRAMRSHYLVQDLYQMLAWQHVSPVYDYDVVIINKTNPGWFVPKDDQTTVWFIHSTPRGQNDMFHKHGRTYLSRLLKLPMRPLYQPNTKRADAWGCNSELVQRRLFRYWGIPEEQVDVIYPPVRTRDYGPEHATGDGNYYFTMSRLHGHKRVGEIVAAFTELRKPLVVAGTGPERERLESMAGDNIEFVGYVSEEEKRQHLAQCRAFVMNAENEDFGITPIEAMASGTPVLGVEEGYTAEQIIDYKNGLTYERGELPHTVRVFEASGVEWSAEQIQAFADRFDARHFREGIRALVSRGLARAEVIVPWKEGEEVEQAVELDRALADGGSS